MKYTVIGKSVVISGGLLTLSEAQAKDRGHLLAKSKKGQYLVAHPVTFKQCETFGFDGQLDKYQSSLLLSEKDAEKEAAAHKASEEAKAQAEKEAAEKAVAEAKAKAEADQAAITAAEEAKAQAEKEAAEKSAEKGNE